MVEQIQTESLNDLTRWKLERKAEWQFQMKKVAEKFSGGGQARFAEREEETKQLTAAYEKEVNTMDRLSVDQCQAELKRYRRRVERIRNILSGRQVASDEERQEDCEAMVEYKEYKRQKENWMRIRKDILKDAETRTKDLDPAKMGAEGWTNQMKRIIEDRNTKMEFSDKQKQHWKMSHTGVSEDSVVLTFDSE